MRWLLILVVACSSPQHSMPADNTAPIWFRGVWKREWMKDGASAPLEDRIVRDVQTPSIFGSVRVPLSRPKISAKSFDELDDAQLHALLDQKGFAGTATFAGAVATWRHDIDFRPPNDVDTARISQQTATMVLEEGLDGGFSELWWNLAPGETRFLGIEERRNGRVEQILSVVGDHFVYARNRAHDLPRADSLAALAEGKSRAEIIALLDCEFSYGLVHGGAAPWVIVHSTLPWREGVSLDTAKVRAAGIVIVNTFEPDDLAIMVPR
jgi:hypothetical protein